MIPYYYRINRFKTNTGEFKVSRVSPSSNIGAFDEHPDLADFKKDDLREVPQQKIKSTYVPPGDDEGEFHLLESNSQTNPDVDWYDVRARHPESTIGAQASLVIVMARKTEDALLFWGLKLSALLNAQIKILAVPLESNNKISETQKATPQRFRIQDQLRKIIQQYREAGHTDPLVKLKPLVAWNPGAKLEENFVQETFLHGTTLALLSGDNENPALIHQVHCPVLWLKGPQTPLDIKNILIAIDADTPSYQLIRQGITLGELFDASLHLMHVSASKQEEKDSTEHLNELSNLIHWKGMGHDTFVSHGGVSKDIVDYAKKNEIDLIVMGTHHFKNKGQTSFAEEVLQASPCPVFILHPYQG